MAGIGFSAAEEPESGAFLTRTFGEATPSVTQRLYATTVTSTDSTLYTPATINTTTTASTDRTLLVCRSQRQTQK